MKNYFDQFYEVLHKNSIKRRRMISLLMVLSIFVSSSVVWELRGTVITMVNEPIEENEPDIEGTDELIAEPLSSHVHTDECYENILICEDESDEHTHSEECYEKQLICGYDDINASEEENMELSEDGEIVYEDENESEEAIEEMDNSEGENEDEEILVDNVVPSEIKLGSATVAMAGETEDYQVIDNIAEGIKFTLFDYGTDELEYENSNYNIKWDSTTNTWIHPEYDGNTNKRGWKASGINSGRNPVDDIMFFAYGTPAFTGRENKFSLNEDDEAGKDYLIYTRIVDGEGHYAPDKNNYSGDYNKDSVNGSPISGNRPVQGIVNNTLDENGYPTISGSNHSLDYLFSPSTNVNGVDQREYKSVYENVNYLLYKTVATTGNHLVFDSNKHYAYFNKNTNNFTVYESTFDIVNDNHHLATDIDPKTGEAYGGENVDPGFKIGFFPFDEYDPTKTDPNFNTVGETYNHHFGMTMEASFDNLDPSNIGDDPVVFKYSGDDDMWVFVDGQLVLDIGGIHEPTSGMIDFTNGLVWVQDNQYGMTPDEVKSEYVAGNIVAVKTVTIGGIEYNPTKLWEELLPKPIGINTASTSTAETNKWIVKPITDFISDWDSNETRPAIGKHDIKMFYLERGGCYSNLAMEMNLPTLKPLIISKTVDYGSHMENDYDDDEFKFNIYEKDIHSESFSIAQFNDEKYNSPITLRNGEIFTIPEVNKDRQFKIVEEGVDPNVYSETSININTSTPTIENGYDSRNFRALSEANRYDFTNVIKEEYESFNAKKKWQLKAGDTFAEKFPTGYTVKFKVFKNDSEDDEEEPVVFTREESGVNRKFLTWVINCTNANDVTQALGNLPTRYGDHTYSYRIEEMNVPQGFNASYSMDNNTMVITNKDQSDVEINVKKEWKNIADGQKPDITLQLKRKIAPYNPSSAANLTVRMVDMGGNELSTRSITTEDDHKVYEGGNAEFILSVPEGTVFRSISTSDSKSSAHYYSGVVDVNNIQNNMTVTIKVDNSKAQDSIMLIHSSFSDVNATDEWVAQGGGVNLQAVNNVNTPDLNAIKNGALLVSNRDDSWKGAKLYLSPTQFKPNQAYSFSVRIKVANVGESANFKVSFNDGLEKDGNRSYHQLRTQNIRYSDGWQTISGTVTLPSELNPYGMFLLIETNGGNNPNTSFYIDEVVAVKGDASISVNETTGAVTISPNDDSVFKSKSRIVNDVYANDDPQNWVKNDVNSPITYDSYNGNYSIVITATSTDWNGAIVKNGISLEPGHYYSFNCGIAGMNNPNGNNVDHPNVDLILGYSSSGSSHYDTLIATGNRVNGWDSTQFNSKIIKIPEDATGIILYFQPHSLSNDQIKYKIWNFSINEVTLIDDYTQTFNTIFLDSYQYNLNAYNIDLDNDSATNPLDIGEYDEDPTFNNSTDYTVTLTKNDGKNWSHKWENPSEDKEHYKYKYYITETINGVESDYTTTIIGDDVATNDENNPIIVHNHYIWYQLPATGGIGAEKIYLFGLALTIIGILGGCSVYSRKRRRE